ncbi:MAG: penicillin-binding protein 2, partial [Pseudomonadota bacterium]
MSLPPDPRTRDPRTRDPRTRDPLTPDPRGQERRPDDPWPEDRWDDDAPAPAPEGARLTDVIAARAEGLDPYADAARRREARGRAVQAEARRQARWRLLLLACAFGLAYASVAGRMAVVAATEPREPRALASDARLSAVRAEITDARGALLAANIPVWSLYARPQEMLDPAGAAQALARIFPDLDPAALTRRFTDGRQFLWIKRAIAPAERVAVHDIGEPGLLFGPREMRVYPAGREAAHILGGASFGKEGVHAAEIIGVAGLERALDARLRDPAEAAGPLRLSLDLRAQRAMADVLRDGVDRFDAKGAAGVLMKARTGEVVAMVSLPDFDPNDRPPPPTEGRPADHPTFNRAAQGVYELGSTYKIFTAAMMVEDGLASPDTLVDTAGPLQWGRFKIRDFHRMPPRMTLRDVIVQSSNVGTARLALIAGARRQKAFLRALGLLDPPEVELSEAGRARPLLPPRWSEISTMTISYGHGIAATPLHLAGAYAAMVNGGLKVTPTLLAGAPAPDETARVISEATSREMREMLRAVVTDGTGRNADVPGYALGGKTGSAEKPSPRGGYDEDKVLAVFAGAFPMDDPEYVIVVAVDEGSITVGGKPRRTAGWVAAPLVRETLERVGPLLGLRPRPAPPPAPLLG